MEAKTFHALLHELRNFVGGVDSLLEHVMLNLCEPSIETEIADFRDAVKISADALIKRFEECVSYGARPTPIKVAEQRVLELADEMKRLHGFERVDVIDDVREDCMYYDAGDCGETVLRELAQNAKKSGATRLTIRARRVDGGIRFDVYCDGDGPSEDEIAMMNLDVPALDTSHSGTKIIKRIVRGLGGTVRWSGVEGLATCCTIILRGVDA
jgi:hypothetical protein